MQAALSFREIKNVLADVRRAMPEADENLAELCRIVAGRISSQDSALDFIATWDLAANSLCRQKELTVEVETTLCQKGAVIATRFFPADFAEEVRYLKAM